MPKTVQNTIFAGGGLNTDDAYRFMAPTDAPYRLHVTPAGEGENGVLTNMKGCEQVVLPITITFTSSEVYSVVGSHYNASTRACYYFIHSLPYDSGGGVYKYDNKLLRYNTDTDNVELIFLDEANYLGLSHDTLMKDIRMIETWLYFNPKDTEPKMIDVDMAYNYANYDAYSAASAYTTGDVVTYKGGLFYANQAVSVSESPSSHTAKWDRIGNAYEGGVFFGQSEFNFCFDSIKQPPVKRLGFNYGTEPYYAAGYGVNNLRGKTFRFAYRYQYFDDAYSVFSAHSRPTLPVDGEVYNGEIIGETTINNHIVFQLPLGLPAIVKAVELVFQEGEGDWKVATTIERQEQSLLAAVVQEYKFYNNENYQSLDNSLPNVVASAVPREAGCQEIINLNTLLYGRCKEGFNSLQPGDLDVTLTPVAVELTDEFEVNTLRRDNGTVVGATATGDFTVAVTDEDEEGGFADEYITKLSMTWAHDIVVEGDIFTITVDGIKHTYTLLAPDVTGNEALTDALVAFLGARVSVYVYKYENSGNFYIYFQSPVYYPQVSQCIFYLPTSSVAALAKQSGFKTGAKHPFCILYYDKNLRRGDANISSSTSVYVPQFVEDTDVTGVNFKYTIKWEVNHLPPAYARYWKWGKAANSLTPYFVQYIIADYGNDGALSYLDISPLQTLKGGANNVFPNSIIDEYVWEKGDRVRLITETNDPAVGPNAIGDFLSRVFDYEIVKQDDDTNRIYIQYVASPPNVGENSLIEIYRPKKADVVDVYYEFGDIMPIVVDTAGVSVHGGMTQDQDTALANAATGVFTTGDVYHIIRTPSKPLLAAAVTTGVFHESMHYSDFYISDVWDKGKIAIESRIGEQTLNIIRYSNTYVQGTQLNGLTTFEAGNYKEVNDIYGQIRAMREVGDTLKVYQDVKSSSILIGRQEYSDSVGNTQVVTSNRVLGSIRYSPTSYGTIFPESVTKNNRYVYLFDVYNGAVCRDSANGIFPISGRFEAVDGRGSYKMETYFKEKAKAFLASGVENVKVMTVWDEEYGFLYVTFVDKANADNNDTIVFHEGSNRWITFADLTKVDTWNEFLFPTYTVVRGFESGLEPLYDESDGYTYFTLESSSNASFFTSTIEYEVEVLQATIRTSPNASPNQQDVEIEVLSPAIVISGVFLDPSGAGWEWDEFGTSYATTVTITIPVGVGTITSKPSWLACKEDAGGILMGVGDAVTNGSSVSIYPINRNPSGVQKTGSFTITDSYGNSDSVTVVQNA
jgi:hypothetical protein